MVVSPLALDSFSFFLREPEIRDNLLNTFRRKGWKFMARRAQEKEVSLWQERRVCGSTLNFFLSSRSTVYSSFYWLLISWTWTSADLFFKEKVSGPGKEELKEFNNKLSKEFYKTICWILILLSLSGGSIPRKKERLLRSGKNSFSLLLLRLLSTLRALPKGLLSGGLTTRKPDRARSSLFPYGRHDSRR